MFRKFISLTVLAIALASFHSAEAQEPKSGKAKVYGQINHCYNRGGQVVKVPGVVMSPIAVSDQGPGDDEAIDEPEFIWNRSSRSWMKNPRHGLAKANSPLSRTVALNRARA